MTGYKRFYANQGKRAKQHLDIPKITNNMLVMVW